MVITRSVQARQLTAVRTTKASWSPEETTRRGPPSVESMVIKRSAQLLSSPEDRMVDDRNASSILVHGIWPILMTDVPTIHDEQGRLMGRIGCAITNS